MPPRRVLIIGSGPIVIGQAAEFDYAGVQACLALRDEGMETVLVNSNPATVMTDPDVGGTVVIGPLTVAHLERVIAEHRPDALLPTLGGQTGLNLAVGLDDAGVLDRYAVQVLGTPLAAVRAAEDRGGFRALVRSIGEPVPESRVVESVADWQSQGYDISIPVMPEYGFSMVFDVSKMGVTGQEVCVALFKRHVAVYAGDGLGDVGASEYIRINISRPDLWAYEKLRDEMIPAVKEAQSGVYGDAVASFFEEGQTKRGLRIAAEIRNRR